MFRSFFHAWGSGAKKKKKERRGNVPRTRKYHLRWGEAGKKEKVFELTCRVD